MTNIVFLDSETLPQNIFVRRPIYKNKWKKHPTTNPNETIQHCKNADIVITNKVVINEAILAACPSIKHIAVAATGYNNIDTAACKKHGVSVSNIRHYANTSVPEHVIAMSLTLRRELLQYRQAVIDGKWQKSPHFCLYDKPINDLQSTTFGIIGFGELGQATAKLANTLGMNVICSSRSKKLQDSAAPSYAQQVNFDELIETADIISCHCSLNDDTLNLIDSAQFEKMQNHAIVINTARGGIVNEAALVNAIKTKQIGGTGVDVLTQEPPIDGSLLLEIAHLTNVIITPHMAWGSQQALQALADQLIDNVEAFMQQAPQNLIDL